MKTKLTTILTLGLHLTSALLLALPYVIVWDMDAMEWEPCTIADAEVASTILPFVLAWIILQWGERGRYAGSFRLLAWVAAAWLFLPSLMMGFMMQDLQPSYGMALALVPLPTLSLRYFLQVRANQRVANENKR